MLLEVPQIHTFRCCVEMGLIERNYFDNVTLGVTFLVYLDE